MAYIIPSTHPPGGGGGAGGGGGFRPPYRPGAPSAGGTAPTGDGPTLLTGAPTVATSGGSGAGRFIVAKNLGQDLCGKQMRRVKPRKTRDYNSAVMKHILERVWRRPGRDQLHIPASVHFMREFVLPNMTPETPAEGVCTQFVDMARPESKDKKKYPVHCVKWMPDCRRIVQGSHTGELFLWNGLTFHFEQITEAHNKAIRAIAWTHNGNWMLTGDDSGFLKIWQPNMNEVKRYQAHKDDTLRDISVAPTDAKVVTCGDDATLRIIDFYRCAEEQVLRGHGWDVKSCDWHPTKGVIASGSKDNVIKLWDPRSGLNISTIHAHKNTVTCVQWNRNGNWLLSGARDQLCKLYDVRAMKELITFRGIKRDVSCVRWHPVHERLFSCGGSEGDIAFYLENNSEPCGYIERAHEQNVSSLDWHPHGTVMVSGSNDRSLKFWGRTKPGSTMEDRYHLNTNPPAMMASGNEMMSMMGPMSTGGGGGGGASYTPRPSFTPRGGSSYQPRAPYSQHQQHQPQQHQQQQQQHQQHQPQQHQQQQHQQQFYPRQSFVPPDPYAQPQQGAAAATARPRAPPPMHPPSMPPAMRPPLMHPPSMHPPVPPPRMPPPGAAVPKPQ